MNRLKGKVAVITGASGGLGAGIARAMAEEGACVVLVARREEELRRVTQQIHDKGGKAVYMVGDVTDNAVCEQVMELASSTYGRLDILINNAGMPDFHMTAVNTPDELWDRVFALNSKSRFLCIRAALKHMIEQGSGNIVNLSSICGVYGNAGVANSSAMASCLALTKNVALQYLYRNIRCNAVCPGPTLHDPVLDPPITRGPPPASYGEEERVFDEVILKRHMDWNVPVSQLEEQVNIVLFLASDESSAITGQYIVADHGMCL